MRLEKLAEGCLLVNLIENLIDTLKITNTGPRSTIKGLNDLFRRSHHFEDLMKI